MNILNHFKSDLIDNMDKMRTPGTEPSSVPKKVVFKKLKSDSTKIPDHEEGKMDGLIIPQIYNFNQFITQKILMLSNSTNQPKSAIKLGSMCPWGSLVTY